MVVPRPPLTLSAAASDDTGILKVTFFADGVEIAADPDSPYQAVCTVPAFYIVGTLIRFYRTGRRFRRKHRRARSASRPGRGPRGRGDIRPRVYDDTLGLPVENAAVSRVSVHGEYTIITIDLTRNLGGI